MYRKYSLSLVFQLSQLFDLWPDHLVCGTYTSIHIHVYIQLRLGFPKQLKFSDNLNWFVIHQNWAVHEYTFDICWYCVPTRTILSYKTKIATHNTNQNMLIIRNSTQPYNMLLSKLRDLNQLVMELHRFMIGYAMFTKCRNVQRNKVHIHEYNYCKI